MINLIVTIANNGVIGDDGSLPWTIPAILSDIIETTKKYYIDHSFCNSRIIFHCTPVISGPLPDTVRNLR